MAMMLAEEAAGSDVDVRSFSAVPPGVKLRGGPPGNTGHLIVYHCALNWLYWSSYCEFCEKSVWLLWLRTQKACIESSWTLVVVKNQLLEFGMQWMLTRSSEKFGDVQGSVIFPCWFHMSHSSQGFLPVTGVTWGSPAWLQLHWAQSDPKVPDHFFSHLFPEATGVSQEISMMFMAMGQNHPQIGRFLIQKNERSHLWSDCEWLDP